MLRVGIVGFGFMGRTHCRCWRQMKDVVVAAVCDSDPRSLMATAKASGNIAGVEGDADLAGANVYGDLGEMLRRERLDALSIATPTYLHAPATIAALEAGLHVLCEKPIALTVADGRRMIEAANRCKKTLQIGHCVRFWPEYAKAKELVDGGQFGRVIAAVFQRLSATAARKSQSWFVDQTRSGGMPLDLHIHDADFIQHLFGMPRNVQTSGAPGPGGSGLAHLVTCYGYGDEKLVVAEGGWAMTASFGLEMRFRLVLEHATLAFDYGRRPSLFLYPEDGEPRPVVCGDGDAYLRQIEHFARRIRGESTPPIADAESALNSLRVVLAECKSAETGERINLDQFGMEG